MLAPQFPEEPEPLAQGQLQIDEVINPVKVGAAVVKTTLLVEEVKDFQQVMQELQDLRMEEPTESQA